MLFHLINYQKVAKDIEKMLYMKTFESSFQPIIQPFFITFLSFTINISTQIIGMIMMVLENHADRVLIIFVGMTFICRLDEVFFDVNSSPLKK